MTQDEMSNREYLQAFMVRQTVGLSPTPLLEAGLIAATGPGNTWALTELGHELLNGPIISTIIEDEIHNALDKQIGGDHYSKLGHYQPWEVLSHWLTPEELRGYMKGTIIAYLARERDKGGDTDIAKAMHTGQLWQEVRKDK
jgi:Protein of unknwon function (DUF3310)